MRFKRKRMELLDMKLIKTLKQHQFLFEELVKRDFNKKYKRTVLGVLWSILSPLLMLFVMKMVFTQLLGRTTPHYTIYLFCGYIIFNYFSEATKGGMSALMSNAGIFTKVNVPKHLFVLSKNVQSFVNFLLILVVFFVFVAFDGLAFTWKFVLLLYPIFALALFNIGVSMILSALFVFFKDIKYLYDVFSRVIMYLSAIFYNIKQFPEEAQRLFLLNPVYVFISYFRSVVINATVPSLTVHLMILAHTVLAVGIGCLVYKKYNCRFLYYV